MEGKWSLVFGGIFIIEFISSLWIFLCYLHTPSDTSITACNRLWISDAKINGWMQVICNLIKKSFTKTGQYQNCDSKIIYLNGICLIFYEQNIKRYFGVTRLSSSMWMRNRLMCSGRDFIWIWCDVNEINATAMIGLVAGWPWVAHYQSSTSST